MPDAQADFYAKWGIVPGSAEQAVPEAPAQPTAPSRPLGGGLRGMLKTAGTVAVESPLLGPAAGFGVGLYNVGKGLLGLAPLAVSGLLTGLKDPALAAKAVGNLAVDAYNSLVNVDPSKMSPAAGAHVRAAIASFEKNPGFESGKMIAEALSLVAPGKTLAMLKTVAKALPTASLTGLRVAGAGAQVARAAEEVPGAAALLDKIFGETAPAAPAVVARPVSRRAAAQAALAKMVEEPVKAMPAEVSVGPTGQAVTRTLPEIAAAQRTVRAGAVAQERMVAPRPTQKITPSVAPAPPVAPEAASPAAVVQVMPQAVAPAPTPVKIPVKVSVVEEPLVKRLMGTGLSREESLTIIQKDPREVQRILSRAAAKGAAVVPEVPARTAQGAPEPLQAAPVVSPAAVPSAAPAPATEPTAPMPEVPAAAPSAIRRRALLLPDEPVAPIKIPLPARVAETPVQAGASVPPGSPEAKAIIAKVRAGMAKKPLPVVPERPAAVKIVSGVPERIPGQGILMQPAESGTIESWGYRQETGELAVKLKRETMTRVYSVDQATADQFAAAPSKGKAYNELLRGQPSAILASPDAELKKLADAVEGHLARGASDVEIAQGIAPKARELGFKPKEFITQVRQSRGIPEEPEEFVAWGKKYRQARAAVVAEAPATKGEFIKTVVEPEPVVAKVPEGFQVENLKPEASFVEDSIKSVEGGSEFMRTGAGWTKNYPEMLDKIQPGFGERWVRAGTIADRFMAGAAKVLKEVRFNKLTAAEDAAVADHLLEDGTRTAALTPRARVVVDLVEKAAAARGVTAAEDLAAVMKDAAERLPMKKLIPFYLPRVAAERGLASEFGSADDLIEMLSTTPHPDGKRVLEGVRRFLGTDYVSYTERAAQQVGSLANAVSAGWFLKYTTTIKHVGQVVPAAAKTPILSMARGLAEALTPAGRAEAELSGALLRNMRELMGTELRSMSEVGLGGRAADILRTVAGVEVGLTGIGKLVNFIKKWVYLAKNDELTRLVAAADSGSLRAQGALRRMGVDMAAENMGEEIQFVAKEFTDRMTLRSDIINTPAMMTTPFMQFARGLQMYAINTTKMIYKEFINPTLSPRAIIVKEGVGAYLDQLVADAKLLGYGAAVGTLVAETEAFLKNKVRPQDTAMRLAEAWTYIGTFGVMRTMLNGIVDQQGRTIEAGKWPAYLARNWGFMVGGLTSGSGLQLIGEIPTMMTSPHRIKYVPLIGDILYGQTK